MFWRATELCNQLHTKLFSVCRPKRGGGLWGNGRMLPSITARSKTAGRHLPKQKRNCLFDGVSPYWPALGVMIAHLLCPPGFTAVRIKITPEAWLVNHQCSEFVSLCYDMWKLREFPA